MTSARNGDASHKQEDQGHKEGKMISEQLSAKIKRGIKKTNIKILKILTQTQ